MPLSGPVVKELEAELRQEESRSQRLLQERAKLDSEIALCTERIRSIRSLLGKQGSEHAQSKLADVPLAQEEAGGLGVRDAIRSVLGSAPQGLKPKEVTRLLRHRRFQYDGQLDLGVRISSEMWRMEKGGQLQRAAGGRYTLVRQAS